MTTKNRNGAFNGIFLLKPSIVHEMAAAYAFQRIGRDEIQRREFRRLVCPKLGIAREDADAMEKDLLARGVIMQIAKGVYRHL